MRKPLVIAAIVCLLCSYSCAPLLDAQDPASLRQRAASLRMQAAALRKDASECAILAEHTEADLRTHQTKLDVLVERRDEEAEHVERLRTKMAALDGGDTEGPAAVLKQYETTLASADALVAGELVKIRGLNEQLEDQRWLCNTYLHRADGKEEEARRCEQEVERLSEM